MQPKHDLLKSVSSLRQKSESSDNKQFWTPAFAGVTALMSSHDHIKQKAPWLPKRLFALKDLGGVLLSHVVPHAVPSALKSLTSVFGMGTGVSSSPSPPKTGQKK
jgi:hypothetical protein